MPEEEIIDSLDLIAESAHLVLERFSRIKGPDDFVITPEGVLNFNRLFFRCLC